MRHQRYLFDVTRLISRSWTKRRSTGLDRVSYAYLEQFRDTADAVVQHKGLTRILSRRHSAQLFDLLQGDDAVFRQKMISFTPAALMAGSAQPSRRDAIYLNVSHTEFDLASHANWVQQSKVRPIYLIHDLIPINHPEFCRPKAVDRHRGRVTNALKIASGIIVNSRATAADLSHFAVREDLPQPPIRAIPIAGAKLRKSKRRAASVAPYFVCVGTIEPRKNHLFLLRLWEKLIARHKDKAPHLLIIGQWGVNSGAVRQMLEQSASLKSHVTVLTDCLDSQLGDHIAGARALLMPTLAEGFGLPLVEAMVLGTPVIASDLPSFREMGHAIPRLIAPHDEAAWLHAIHGYCSDSSERTAQIHALRTYRAPTWADHFAEIEDWLASLQRRGQSSASGGVGYTQSPLAEAASSVSSRSAHHIGAQAAATAASSASESLTLVDKE